VAGQVAKGVIPAGPEQAAGGGQAAEPPDDAKPDDAKAGEPPQESVPQLALARYRRRLTEALRSMPVTEAARSIADRIYDTLTPSFPPAAIAWIKDDAAGWNGPKWVPLDQIDIHDSREWDATRPADATRIASARRKLRKKLAGGKKPKPVILIRWPGAGKWVISDGHHRFVAAQREGQEKIWAYTGRVPQEKGHWLSMATHEDRGKKAA
jgi:hypothetical protein